MLRCADKLFERSRWLSHVATLPSSRNFPRKSLALPHVLLLLHFVTRSTSRALETWDNGNLHFTTTDHFGTGTAGRDDWYCLTEFRHLFLAHVINFDGHGRTRKPRFQRLDSSRFLISHIRVSTFSTICLPSLDYIHRSHDPRSDRVVGLHHLPRLSCPSADHTRWAHQDGNMRHQSIAVPQYAIMHSLHAVPLQLISVK